MRALMQHSPDVLFAEFAKLRDQQLAKILETVQTSGDDDLLNWIKKELGARAEELLSLKTAQCLTPPTVNTPSNEPMQNNEQRLPMAVIEMNNQSKKNFEVCYLSVVLY